MPGPKSKLQAKKMAGGGTSTYAGGNYCGPGWGFTRQDVEAGKVAQLPEAVDAIDRACKAHDQCYADNGYLTLKCNVALAAELKKIVLSPTSTTQQRIDAYIMAAVFEWEARHVDPAVFVVRDVLYRKLWLFIVARWNRGKTEMETILFDAYMQLNNMLLSASQSPYR